MSEARFTMKILPASGPVLYRDPLVPNKYGMVLAAPARSRT